MPDNNGFKLSTAEWKGYVKGILENMHEDISDIKKKIDLIDRQQNKLRVKVAGIGATVSLITSLLFLLVKELIAK